MSKGKSNLTKILISLVFISFGLDSVIRAFNLLIELNIGGILSCTLGLLMFVMGIMGLFKVNIKVCRILAVIVCILSAANFINGLLAPSFQTQMLVQALLAFVYFDC